MKRLSSTGAGSGGKASHEETPARPEAIKKAKAEDDDIDKTKKVPSRTRGRYQAEPWDVFKLIYFDRQGSSVYQLTCTNPQHNHSGKALCTKSRSERFEGGADMCLRMLKQWALMGVQAASKEAHQDQWAAVLKSFSEGTVWTDKELEAQRVGSWADHARPVASGPSS